MNYFKKQTKRALALFLSLVMCLSLMQVTAFAGETEENQNSVTEEQESASKMEETSAPKEEETADKDEVPAPKEEEPTDKNEISASKGEEPAAKDEEPSEENATTEIPVTQNEDESGEPETECAFTAEKTAPYEYTISGTGEFAGEFLLDGKKTTFPKIGYTAVKKLTLSEGITSIADETFNDYYVGRGLKEVVLPTSLTRIGARAFYGGVLEKINLEYVTSVGEEAFCQNSKLSTYGNGITELTIPAGMTDVGKHAFYGMGSLKTLTVSEGVTSIDDEAFMQCQSLETVVLPESLTSIGNNAFSNCKALRTIQTSNTGESVNHIQGVTNIGDYVFEGCSALENISISGSQNIGNSVFFACSALKHVKLSDIENVGNSAFSYAGSDNLTVELDRIGTVGQYAFYQCPTLEKATLTDVKDIGQYSFYGFTGTEYSCLKELTISGTENIGKLAFAYCPSLEKVSLDDIGSIGQQAFLGCTALKSISMGKVNTIGIYAFMNCTNLNTIDTLTDVGRIDGFAFYNCPALTDLTVEDMTKMGFNGNYGDVMSRVEAILKGEFKLDNAPGIVDLTPDPGWSDSKSAKSENWDKYDNGTQLVEQARWKANSGSTIAEVKADAYYTAEKQMDYIFVADLSASMAQLGNEADQNSRFYDMQSKLLDVTGQLLGSAGYDCQVAIVTFGGLFGEKQTCETMEFTDNASIVKEHINGLEPLYESTDYGLGLKKALELAEKNTDRNTVVIFLSDGQPTVNGSGDQAGTTAAEAIRNLNVPIYGVLHSPGSAHDKALDAMKAVCGDNTVYESTDTKSFGEAMNKAFAAVYPNYTVTIPVGEAFGNVQNIKVSESAGEATLSEDGKTITWTITGMPFTKHTLTFEATANRYGTLDVNGEKAALSGGSTEISIDTPQLTRTEAPQPIPTHILTINYVYENGTQARDPYTATLEEGVSYTVTSPSISGYSVDQAEVTGTMGTDDVTITVTYKSSGGGGSPGGGGSRLPDNPTPTDPGTTITDPDVPLAPAPGLNSTDHYAYIAGYPDGTVRPQSNITRAEVATIFFRLMTDEFRTTNWASTNNFPDVADASLWYNNAVSTAAKAGLLKGKEDGKLYPSANITRAEFATIAARFTSDEEVTAQPFPDTVGHWAEKDIIRAVQAGWIKGNSDGTFRPNDPITRAEAMTLVNRMLDRVPDKDHMLSDMVTWPDNPVSAWFYEAVQEATNSHDYERDEMGVSETWTGKLPDRDWSALEKEWSNAASSTGKDVAGDLQKD